VVGGRLRTPSVVEMVCPLSLRLCLLCCRFPNVVTCSLTIIFGATLDTEFVTNNRDNITRDIPPVLTRGCLIRLRMARVMVATPRMASWMMVRPHRATLPMRTSYSTTSVVSYQVLGVSAHSVIRLVDRITVTSMSIVITPSDTNVPNNLRALAYHETAIRNNNT
jgi:hypothetical protein